MTDDVTITPDTKVWTWVLEEPCPECGYDAGAVARDEMASRIRDDAAEWAEVLLDPRAARRPAPGVWSAGEYGCHVRDVHRVFADRIEQMLTLDDPLFANWDQDETAVADRYDEQDPAGVVPDLLEAAEHAAQWYDRTAAVGESAWRRPGRRSNGSIFTVESLGRYHLHDLVHHRWDVRWIMAG